MKKNLLLLLALGLSMLSPCCLYAQDINISLNSPRQGIDGAGFCHEGDRQNGDNYIINTSIQQMLDNHMTLFRDMFPNKTWEPTKGNFGYNDSRVINSFQRLKIMQDRGIKTILGIWDVPNWLVSNPSQSQGRKINNMDDFADFITSFLVRGKNTYNLTIDYIDINETKTSEINLALTAQEYITLIQKCQERFTANGIQTKINMGSVLLWDIQYCKDIYNAVKTLPAAGFPSWHSYRGGSTTGREPISYWEQWGAWQQTLDRHLWGTETDYDAFYYNNPDRYTWKGIEEMAVMYYRNYYVARMSTSAGWYWHPEWPSNNVHTAYMNFFEPGGQVLETTQPDSDIMTVAYKHEGKKKFVIQVLNQGSGTHTVTFHGVPAGKTLTLLRTSESGDRNQTVGTFTPTGSNLTVTLLAKSFNTFYGDLAASTDSTPPAGAAIVYADCNFAGNGVALQAGNYTLAQLQALGVVNDNISSLKVQGGFKVTLYADNNFSGASATFTADGACLTANSFNDLTSSLKVETYSPNLAYNRPVTTSSNENTTNTGAKAVDADGNTRWSSAYANNQWIIVDLGANYDVNRVRLAWESAYAKDYQIQFSTDNTNWTTVREFWGKASATADDQTGLTGTARYVKVYCINRATVYGFSLFEFEIYGIPSLAPLQANTAAFASPAKPANTTQPATEIEVFPNPVLNTIAVKLPPYWLKNSIVKVIDSNGKILIQRRVKNRQELMDMSSLPRGLYIIQVSNDINQVTKKVIK